MGSVWVPASVAGIGLLGGVALTVVAAVRRITDRPVPPWLVSLLTIAYGLGASSVVLTWAMADDAVELVVFLALGSAPAIVMARAGRFDLAGRYLLAASIPPLVWWGSATLQGPLNEDFGAADPTLVGIGVPVVFALAGIAGLVLGNRARGPAPLPPADEPDPDRAVSIATAMERELRFGVGDLPNVVSIGTGVIVGTILASVLTAVGVDGWLSSVVGALVTALIGTELFYHVWPRRLARAMATHAFLGSWEVRRFIETTGSRPPTSAVAARRWLEQHPETDENRWVRPELHAWAGQLDAAYDVLDRLPSTTEVDRFERHSLRVYLDTVAGRQPDVAGLAAAAETVGGADSDERLRAIAAAALADARRRLAVGDGDWTEPLVHAQERIGPRALRVQRSDTWRARLAILLVSLATFLAVVWLLGSVRI